MPRPATKGGGPLLRGLFPAPFLRGARNGRATYMEAFLAPDIQTAVRHRSHAGRMNPAAPSGPYAEPCASDQSRHAIAPAVLVSVDSDVSLPTAG
jgi:hypothetical protein